MEKLKNIPSLRFPEFNGNFEQIKFGKLYSFHTTNSLSREKLNYENGNVYNIHYGDIHTKFESHFYLKNENIPLINENVDLTKIKKESFCKNGDIIIADASEDYADIGKSIELIDIDNAKILAGLHTLLARPTSDKTFIGFTSYLLKSWKLRKQIMTIAQGTKVLSLSTGRVSNLELNIPSLPEQQKIASFLSTIDEKIQQLSRKKELLEQYKKGVMQQLFSGKLRFKDENGEDYADWEEKKLGVITNIKKGKQLNKIELTETGDYLCINGGISPSGYTDNFNTLENTITISEGGNSCGFVNFFRCKFWSGGHNYTIEIINPEVTDNDFMFQILKQNQTEIMSLRVGSGLPNIQKKDLVAYPLNLPSSIKEQQKIANFLSSIDVKIESTSQQINQTQSFKKGLLQQLFV